MSITARELQETIARTLKEYPADQRRYFVVHLGDGRQITSMQCNWAQIPLHDIVMLELNMVGNRYCLERRALPSFVEFVYFNTAVRGLKTPERVLSRSIGWHDGKKEYVIRVAERTGKQVYDENDVPGEHMGIHYSHIESPPRHLHHTMSKMLLG
jgi:hypothetical protein